MTILLCTNLHCSVLNMRQDNDDQKGNIWLLCLIDEEKRKMVGDCVERKL